VPSAVYTAFLLRQARGRDLWQSPLLPVRMLLTSVLTGAATLLLATLLGDMGLPAAALATLQVALVAHLLLLAVEFWLPHGPSSRGGGDTAFALRLIARGPLRVPFWSAVVLGHVLPLLLLWWAGTGLLVLPACVLVLVFALVGEHVWVRAPQLIPLS
jgi:formate-dependent nitrite reductase membrane component NrfD